MTTHTSELAELAYAQAEQSLLSFADNNGLADGVTTRQQYIAAYEATRTELLQAYPTLEGPHIGDLLGEAANAAWPDVVDQLI
jgi:hypothetical protein